jgi:hypothetical protein
METCVLCLRTDGGAVGQEHVLQDFLGAGLLLPNGIVCDRCNGNVSALDGDLRRYLSATLLRTDDTPILQGANALVEIDETWWATWIDDPRWRRRLPAQCVVWPDGRVDGHSETEQSMMQMQSELADASGIDRRQSDVHLAIKGQAIVVRSGPRKFYLVAADADEPWARALLPSLSSRPWTFRRGLQARLERDGAPLRAVLDVNVGNANRALIKSGFNFLALILGADIARLPLFDDVRSIILSNAPWRGCILDEAAALDAKSVGAGIFDRTAEQALEVGRMVLQDGCHSVVLGAGPSGIFVFVSVAGCPLARAQLLPALPGFKLDGIIALWIVGPKNTMREAPLVAPTEQVDALRQLLREQASLLPLQEPSVAPPMFIRSNPQPLVFTATYAPGSHRVQAIDPG